MGYKSSIAANTRTNWPGSAYGPNLQSTPFKKVKQSDARLFPRLCFYWKRFASTHYEQRSRSPSDAQESGIQKDYFMVMALHSIAPRAKKLFCRLRHPRAWDCTHRQRK